MRLLLPFLLLLQLLLPPASRGAAPETLSYAGAGTIPLSILYAGALTAFEKKMGVHFGKIDASCGTGRGMEMVLAGEADLGGAGRELTEEEKAKGLVGVTIGYDALALWVNAENPVKNLTRQQAKDILTGRIRNWKELGGHDEAISLFVESLEDRKAGITLVWETLMNRQPLSPEGVTIIEFSRDGMLAASRTPGALSPGSLGMATSLSQRVMERLRPLRLDGVAPTADTVQKRSYPVCRPLVLATNGPAQGNAKRFIDFMLSPEGQAIVARSFVPAVKGK